MLPSYLFFLNETAPTEIYTLSLHDALPISATNSGQISSCFFLYSARELGFSRRSEEHTSELQSLTNLVCRLLLEKKKAATPDRWAPQLAERLRLSRNRTP